MPRSFPISAALEAEFNQLGGFDVVVDQAESILREHGIERPLFSEAEKDLVRSGHGVSGAEIRFAYSAQRSLSSHINDVLQQAADLDHDDGTNCVGVVLQHLVGAKLDLVMGANVIEHHGASVADQSTDRAGDFVLEAVAIHVTTHPSEGLIQKCQANIQGGLKPLIITLSESMEGARFLLKATPIKDRVDVLDATQFLTANVYERSFFKTSECQVTLSNLLARYNEIVTSCETDPRLVVRFDGE